VGEQKVLHHQKDHLSDGLFGLGAFRSAECSADLWSALPGKAWRYGWQSLALQPKKERPEGFVRKF